MAGNGKGYVYLIKSRNQLYKIGSSINIPNRMISLRYMSPVELILAHSIESEDMYGLERALHYKFRSRRDHGEWYDLTEEQVKWIKSLHDGNVEINMVKSGYRYVPKVTRIDIKKHKPKTKIEVGFCPIR